MVIAVVTDRMSEEGGVGWGKSGFGRKRKKGGGGERERERDSLFNTYLIFSS